MEAGYVPLNDQPQSPPSQNIDANSVCLEVENPASGSEQASEVANVRNKCTSILSCLFYVCSAPVLYACVAVVLYACVTVATVAALAICWTAIVVFQLVQWPQSFTKWDVFGNVYKNKRILRRWIVVDLILLLLEVTMFYPCAKYVPGLKLVTIIGLPITTWIKIISVLVGLGTLSQVFWESIHFYVIGRDTSFSLIYNGLINPEAISEIFSCLLFWLAEVGVMNSVPTFKQSKIIGIYTQKWIEACIFVLIGFNIISCFAQMFVWLLLMFDANDSRSEMLNTVLSHFTYVTLIQNSFIQRYAGYVASGIKRSIIFVLSVSMLLLTWQLYFGRHLNLTSQDKRIMQFGTRTLVSVLICSFLWLIKSCILLYWEAHTVYDRLHSKFTDIGKLLYFLVLLSYTHFQRVIDTTDSGTAVAMFYNYSLGGITTIFPRKMVREELIYGTGPNASAYKLMQAAEYFLNA